MSKHSMHDGVRTKVLAELMHHMIGMHKAPAASLPHADGTAKHEAKAALEHEPKHAIGMVIAPEVEETPMEEAHEAPLEEAHEGDLFGRKHGRKEAW